MLITNAWEVLLKARLTQQNNGKTTVIYSRKKGSRRFDIDCDTKQRRTLSLRKVLGRVDLPNPVRNNIRGLMSIRNEATHLGVLAPEARQKILEFSTASVQNFLKLSSEWFGETIEAPYLLPVGFIGDVSTVTATYSQGQRQLIQTLTELSQSSGNNDSEYSVTMHVDVALNRGISGGGNIGLTSDPRYPMVRVTDDEALSRFPSTYDDLVAACKSRYKGFSRNKEFNRLMRDVKKDPHCAYERRLNPSNDSSSTKYFYNVDEVFAKLDGEYERL